MATIRQAVVEQVELLSRPQKQLEYAQVVPIANVPGELVSSFCDDLYHPKSAKFLAEFSESELRELSHLYGLLVEASKLDVPTVEELLKQPAWRSVVSCAKELRATL